MALFDKTKCGTQHIRELLNVHIDNRLAWRGAYLAVDRLPADKYIGVASSEDWPEAPRDATAAGGLPDHELVSGWDAKIEFDVSAWNTPASEYGLPDFTLSHE